MQLKSSPGRDSVQERAALPVVRKAGTDDWIRVYETLYFRSSGMDVIRFINETGHKMRELASLLLTVLLLLGLSSAAPVTIELKHGSDAEQRTKQELERILASYDLSRYTFTHEVIIDEKAIPHSHPVLTLHTQHLGSDDVLLSAYIHEQLHWYLDAHRAQTEAAESELRKLYPKVPVGYPEGAQDEESTYLHLIDCYLEMKPDQQLMGVERAAKVMDFWAGDHYTWVYKTVIRDETMISGIIEKQHLEMH
jgi:hypothetical protein